MRSPQIAAMTRVAQLAVVTRDAWLRSHFSESLRLMRTEPVIGWRPRPPSNHSVGAPVGSQGSAGRRQSVGAEHDFRPKPRSGEVGALGLVALDLPPAKQIVKTGHGRTPSERNSETVAAHRARQEEE